MKKIIVTGHGNFATGLQSTIELLAGKNNDLHFVNFVEGDSDLVLKGKFEKIIEENANTEILFFCDLLGGTPYKTAATLAYENHSLEVVAGCNVGSLLELLFIKENFSHKELARELISASLNATGFFEREISSKVEVEADGI